MRKAHLKLLLTNWQSSDDSNLSPEYGKEFPQPHPGNVPPKRIMHPGRPPELLFNQRLFYMITVIIRQRHAHHLSLQQGRILKRRQGSLPFRGIWKKPEALFFWGLSPNQKRTSNQPSESPPLPKSAQRLQEQTGLLITAWSCALKTNSDKICTDICILVNPLSHKENRKTFTHHRNRKTFTHHPELHPFRDKTPGEILFSITQATEKACVKQRMLPTVQLNKDQVVRQPPQSLSDSTPCKESRMKNEIRNSGLWKPGPSE